MRTKDKIRCLVISLGIVTFISSDARCNIEPKPAIPTSSIGTSAVFVRPEPEPIMDTIVMEIPEETVIFEEEEPEPLITEEEANLIALVTMAEAEGEPEEGKRLVISTILNRVDDVHFPDTIEEVIFQPNQFTSMWNGRIDRCEVREDIYKLVLEEVESRTNYDVIFFTAGAYGKYGTPMFQVGEHYFASY